MEYANVGIEARGFEELTATMDLEMNRRAADGWRVVTVMMRGQDGWGNARVIVTFERTRPQ